MSAGSRMKTGAKFLSSLLLVAATVGAGAFVWYAKPASVEVSPAQIAESKPADLSIVCSGGLSSDGSFEENDLKERSWFVGSPEASSLEDSAGKALQSSNAIYLQDNARLRDVFTMPGTARNVIVGGGTLHTATSGDLRGAAVNPCTSAQSDIWLVGSQSGVGTSNQLIATNTGKNAATVELTAYGSTGELSLGSSAQFSLAPGEMNRMDLDGAIESDGRITLRVSSSSPIAATLQESVLEGARPAGVTFVTPSALGTELVVPGVVVGKNAESIPTARIVNPQDSPAKVSVTVVGSSVLEVDGGSDFSVPAHSTVDVPLGGIDPGTYSVSIASPAAISAAVALVDRESAQAPRDIAWASATLPVTNAGAIFGPLQAEVTMYNPQSAPAKFEMQPIDADGNVGNTISGTVGPQRSKNVEIPEGTIGLLLTSSTPVHAGISVHAGLEEGSAIDWTPVFEPLRQDARQAIAVER